MTTERPWQKWYAPEIPERMEYSTIPLKDQFNQWVAKQPEKPLIYFQDQVLSYAQVDNMSRKLANGLLGLGVKKGDRVSVTLPNIPQFVIACHACLKIGAIIVAANPLYTVPELAQQYRDSGAETVICLDLTANKLKAIMEQDAPVRQVITVPTPQGPVLADANFYSFDDLIQRSSDQNPVWEGHVDDLVLLQYTGGTTGVPKGCCITNKNLIAIATCYLTWASSLIQPEEYKSLCTVPLYHIYGINSQVNFTIYTGGSMVLIPEVTPDTILAAINRHQPTFWPTVPALLQALSLHSELPNSKVKSIQCILSGSAPLPLETMKSFEQISGAKILEGFGGSETTNGITTNPPHRQKAGSIGIPFPDHDLKIVDLADGTTEMPQGEPGEIIVKGPVVIKEYWNNPEETALVIRDGWFYTGDIGYFDEDHYCYIVDRKKDMIICSGFNVYPRDIDEVLFAHPKVLEAGAIGVPDAQRGETVKVFVVTKPGESMTEEEVIDWCRQSLAPYKVPKQVEFIEALPRTNMRKVDRKALRAAEATKAGQ